MKSNQRPVDWPKKALFDQIPLEIIVINREFEIVDANIQAKKKYPGWRYKKCFELYKHKKRKCPGCAAVKTFQDGKTRVDYRDNIDSDGKIHHKMVTVSAYEDKDGKIPYVIEMAIDITDQVNLEREYRLLFDNVPCYVSVIDRNFKVVDSNALFRNTFYKKEARYCYQMYKGRNKVCTNCSAIKAFHTGKPYTSLQVGLDKEGNKTHYMVTAAPLKINGDTVDRVIEMSLDVSELIRLQEKIKQIEKEKLEVERFAAVGQTVAGLAHGIKNILMGLEGGMYIVNSGLQREDNALVSRGWTILQSNIAKISSVVKEYLQFARGSEIQVNPADPVAIAREVVDLFRDLAKQSGIRLTANLQEDIRQAPLDPEGIHTCLSNLVSNAIDACNFSEKKRKKIDVSCYEKDRTITYEVKDNGTGMDYEVKKRIFSNFFTTKASGQGTGLGLLVSRRIIYDHGGQITFESALGRGSLFKIELPRKRLPKLRTSEKTE
ncbi:MAG: GHKL domain-containing protein [Acidobacteria bacterium]|nr:GHKL domain-containing protein [Acidobacteriota bacterium]